MTRKVTLVLVERETQLSELVAEAGISTDTGCGITAVCTVAESGLSSSGVTAAATGCRRRGHVA